MLAGDNMENFTDMADVGLNDSEDIAQEMPLEGIMSMRTAQILSDAVEYSVNFNASILSIIGNLLSVITFSKMGFQDTINISLTFICALDFVRSIFAFINLLYGPLRLVSEAFSLTWGTIVRVTIGFMNVSGSYTSGVIAGYVALERCLCVSLPFTVKFLLTRRVVLINNILIYLLVFGSFMVFYCLVTFVWIFNPQYNTTIPVMVYTPLFLRHPELNVYMTVIGTLWSMLSFVVMCICTCIIYYHLRKSFQFKSRSTGTGGNSKTAGRISMRDAQTMKLLLVVIMVYIGISVPKFLMFLLRNFYPEFDMQGREAAIFGAMGYVANAIDTINPAVNIFIFYFMSSQFKATFKATFGVCCRSRSNKEKM